jgi:hypothetical protein
MKLDTNIIEANGLMQRAVKMATRMSSRARKDPAKYSGAMGKVGRLMSCGDWVAAMKLMEKVMGNTAKVTTKKSSLSDWADDILEKAGPYIGVRGGKWADPQHKIPWKEKKHAGKKEPKAKQHDEHHATEIQLISDNTGPDPRAHYASERGSAHQIHQHRKAVETNLVKKIASGKYDHAQATKLWEHHAKQVSDHGAKHHGSGKADAATRMAAAKEMADDFHDNVKDGYHDDHEALTGVHAKRVKEHKKLYGGGLSSMAEAHGDLHVMSDHKNWKKTRRGTLTHHSPERDGSYYEIAGGAGDWTATHRVKRGGGSSGYSDHAVSPGGKTSQITHHTQFADQHGFKTKAKAVATAHAHATSRMKAK